MKRILKIVGIIVVGATILAGIIYYYVILHKPLPWVAQPQKQLIPLGAFTTNLANPKSPHFIKVTLAVSAFGVHVNALYQKDKASIDTEIIRVLKQSHYQKLFGGQSVNTLRAQLAKAIASKFHGVKVMKIYLLQMVLE